MITIDTIISLIRNEGESEYLDFKAKSYQKERHEDLIKDIMAMANSLREGDKYIVTGIKHTPDNKKEIIGIEETIDEANYIQLIHNNVEPEINFSYITLDYMGKKIGIFRIYNNNNRPYMLKKDYRNLHEGLCLTRRGCTQRYVKRYDFDQFYKPQKKLPWFKVPNQSERKLSVKDDAIISVIKDDVFLRNVGDTSAIDVEIHLFLNVYIASQEWFMAGDIMPSGTLSLAELDKVIMLWKQEITKRKGRGSSWSMNHSCSMLVQYQTEAGLKLAQPIQAAFGWGEYPEQHLIDIGYDSEMCEPIESKPINFDNEIADLKKIWIRCIKERKIDQLENIDEDARELAWKIYLSGSSEAGYLVNQLFTLSQDTEDIREGILAYEKLKTKHNKNYDKEEMKELLDWLVYGANALHRHRLEEQLEKDFWKIFRVLGGYQRHYK